MCVCSWCSCFFNCTHLKSIEGLGNVVEIGDSAFSNCRGLESLEGLGPVTKMGNDVFDGCRDFSVEDYVKTLYFSERLIRDRPNLFGPIRRDYIKSVFIVALRINNKGYQNQEFGNSVVESDSDQGLSLAPELWYFILQFVNRLDMRSQGRAVSKRGLYLRLHKNNMEK